MIWLLRYKINSFEPLAQSVEHLTFNQVVVGSTPTRLTKHSRVYGLFRRPFLFVQQVQCRRMNLRGLVLRWTKNNCRCKKILTTEFSSGIYSRLSRLLWARDRFSGTGVVLQTSPSSSPAQDTALSRRRHRFKSGRGRQKIVRSDPA